MASARERSKEATRQAVLEAALEILAVAGAEALTMRKLAAAVGYTPGALYTHFESKTELMLWLAYDVLGRVAEALRSGVEGDEIGSVYAYLQANAADRTVLTAVLSGEMTRPASAEGVRDEIGRLVLGRLIRILRGLAPSDETDTSQLEAISLLALLIGALTIENAALLKSLGFTGADILTHYAALEG